MVSKKTRIGLYVAMFVLLVGFGILNGIVVAGCAPETRDGASPEVKAPEGNSGGKIEVLAKETVGDATTYLLWVYRPGYTAYTCVMVQNNDMVGAFVAISCK